MANDKESMIIKDFLIESFSDDENLGIPGNGFIYQRLNESHDSANEFFKTTEFLNTFFTEEVRDKIPELVGDDFKLDFINYGDTQLVYVLNVNNKKWSVLVTQPAAELGIGKCEFENLRQLSINNPEIIVKPKYYFTDGERELYIAPYIYQARCIASQEHSYGIYIPEPYYRFEEFSIEEQKNVNTCIIANLIKLFDEEENQGLCSCKIGGGDFILEKSWSYSDKSIETTLKKMKLIAARELLTTNFSNYQQLLMKEFSQRTYYNNLTEKDHSILINHKNRIPMSSEEIEDGIKLGLKLRRDNYIRR